MSATALTTPMVYVQSDVPEGLTLRDWRAGHVRPGASIAPLSGVVRRVRRSRRARQRRDANVALGAF